MTDQTTERAFEGTVESMLVDGGWLQGDVAEWDVERAVSLLVWWRFCRLGSRSVGGVGRSAWCEFGCDGC